MRSYLAARGAGGRDGGAKDARGGVEALRAAGAVDRGAKVLG